MVTKVYVSGISASQEVRKKQQRVLNILESLKIAHEVVDITEPGKEEEKALMREECTKHEKTNTLPPQIFSDKEYLGDYSDFENATENDNILGFLKLAADKVPNFNKSNTNGVENGGGDRVTESVTEEVIEEGEKKMDVGNGLVINGDSHSGDATEIVDGKDAIKEESEEEED